MSSPARRARALAEQLLEVIEDSIADLDRMPFFVRPMVKRGYKKRTNRSMDQWLQTARGLMARLERGGEEITQAGVWGSDTSLSLDLAALIENYRTTPARAARGMSKVAPATIRMLEQTMERREQTVRDLHEVLHELPEG